MAAVCSGNYEISKALIESKANVNYINYEGVSILYAAAERGLVDICKLLVEFGADLNFL